MKAFKYCILMLLIANLAWADFPPYPDPSKTPIYYGVYPVSIKVPYGANSTDPFTTALSFYIVNQTSNTYNLSDFTLTQVTGTGSNPVTVSSYSNNCSSKLNPSGSNGVCTITVNISAVNNSGSDRTYEFSFAYSGGRAKATLTSPTFTVSFATGASVASAARTVQFINNCTYDVWFGITSGAVDAIHPNPAIKPADPKSCLNHTDCYEGSTCVTVQATPELKHCLWNNPAPSGSGNPFHLLANNASGTIEVTFPAYDNGISTQWNGGVGGRVGCSDSTSTACTIADCGADPSGTACPVPSSFANPATQAEFTFLTENPVVTANSGYPSVDTYDITIINGVTVPTSMKPTTVAWGGASDPYTCAEPGGVSQTSTLGNCKWFNKAAQDNDFVWVATGTPGTCTTTESTCSGSETCGHTISGATVSSSLVCGTQLGYLTADTICAIDSDFGSPFNCGTKVEQNQTEYTLAEIFGCSKGDFKNSCYSAGATDACCGCQDWWDKGVTVPSSKTQSCGTVANSNWQYYLINSPNDRLVWLKDLCPTAYIYPFDDASSTFTCKSVDSNNRNVVNYTVTFCPT